MRRIPAGFAATEPGWNRRRLSRPVPGKAPRIAAIISNGYGLMPSPNLIAATLARRTRDTAICVMGNSLARYNPPTRVAEEFAMLDCISGGRLIAGFPVGSPMDTCYAFGQNPSLLRPRYHEAHDLILTERPDGCVINSAPRGGVPRDGARSRRRAGFERTGFRKCCRFAA